MLHRIKSSYFTEKLIENSKNYTYEKLWSPLFWLFHEGRLYHIETSSLIYSAN